MALVLDEWMQSRWIRKAVVRSIESGRHPARADVDEALKEIPDEPVPPALIEYVRRVYVRAVSQRRPGPTAGRKNATRDQIIHLYYRSVLAELRASEQSRRVKRRAKHDAARYGGVSVRTVERIIAAAPRKS